MQMTAPIMKTVTLKAREPASTRKVVPLKAWWMAAIAQATPMPRNTLTALLPVTLPIDESAKGSWVAAVLDANVSETLPLSH